MGVETAQPDAARFSLDEFVERTTQKNRGEGFFELESTRMLPSKPSPTPVDG